MSRISVNRLDRDVDSDLVLLRQKRKRDEPNVGPSVEPDENGSASIVPARTGVEQGPQLIGLGNCPSSNSIHVDVDLLRGSMKRQQEHELLTWV